MKNYLMLGDDKKGCRERGPRDSYDKEQEAFSGGSECSGLGRGGEALLIMRDSSLIVFLCVCGGALPRDFISLCERGHLSLSVLTHSMTWVK